MKTDDATSVRALHVTIAAARDEVFAYLADIENLPRWADSFCAQLEVSSRGWRAWTPFGDLFLELEADARTGVIDLHIGDACEPLAHVPLRVWARPDGGTLVGGWLARPPGQTEANFALQVQAFAGALERLPERWSSPVQRRCA